MSANWTAIEDAIFAWVKNASGLDAAQLMWAEQTSARLSSPYITLRLGDIIPLGAVDEVEELTDLDRDPGEEVELRVHGVREFVLSVQCFADPVTGTSTARALLSKVQTALALPSVREALAVVYISPFDVKPVQNVTALVGTKFESRALFEVRFYVNETVSEYTGYIDEVEAESYLGPPDSGTRDEIDI